jgi:glucose-1-phosphate cytidylyltransferase
MKVVILAGGMGTRLAEETEVRPKPMVEIGGRPILWHIMKHYAHYGLKEFCIALGHKGEFIKQFFLDYYRISRDVTIDLGQGHVEVRNNLDTEDWIVHLESTGLESLTGERIRRLKSKLVGETFMVTYGDGVSDVNFTDLLAFHKRTSKLATVTAVRPPARFGGLIIDGDIVADFTEKPQAGEGWINGGFLVFEPGVFDFISEGNVSLEAGVLEKLTDAGELACYKHDQFWQCMDTTRDLRILRDLWEGGRAPWKVWGNGY